MNKPISILDIPFTDLKQTEILQLFKDHLRKKDAKALFIATPNPEMLLACRQDHAFKKILQNTDLNLPDGNGIIWAHKYLQSAKKTRSRLGRTLLGISSIMLFLFQAKNDKKRFNQAIHGSDMTRNICMDKRICQHRIFLLGNKAGLAPNTSQLAAIKLQQQNPELNIVGTWDCHLEDKRAIEKIQNSKAEILLIAFGAPGQEKWLSQYLSELPSVKIAMGVGGTFDFLAGIIPRAPNWIRKIGLEWFYRLCRQPRKRFKRIFNAFFVFPSEIIRSSWANPYRDSTSDI